MPKRLSSNYPMGRLYEPLHDLAARLRRTLGKARKTLWTDGSGRVFMGMLDQTASPSECWIIGTYDIEAPVSLIEGDLRLALRARASLWITDWEVVQPAVPHSLIRLGSNKRSRHAI